MEVKTEGRKETGEATIKMRYTKMKNLEIKKKINKGECIKDRMKEIGVGKLKEIK